uniref:phosphopyruvate hydratase n=1 Tax=Malurus cyaneus samueli TaxID=2593467 RepID=A0A8C5SYT6_9PASS
MAAGEQRGQLQREAAEYYHRLRVPERLETALNTLFLERPRDLYGELANYLCEFSKAPVICRIVGRRVFDGVFQPTLEVEIYCIVRNYEKRICSIVIASHSQIPENALPETIEADEKERNDSVCAAVEWVNEPLKKMLRGLKPIDQCQADKILGEYFADKLEEEQQIQKQKEEEEAAAKAALAPSPPPTPRPRRRPGLKMTSVELLPPAEPAEPVLCGSLAIGGTSLAIAKAGATIRRVPLYLHIAQLKHHQKSPQEIMLPIPMVTVLNCEKKLPTKLKLVKEVIFIPPVELSLKQVLFLFFYTNVYFTDIILSTYIIFLLVPCKAKVLTDVSPNITRISRLGSLSIGYDNLEQLLLLMETAFDNIGLELGKDMYLAINCAAHELVDYEKGKYEIVTGTFKSPDEMVPMYVEMIENYPFIIALIDPLRKEDREQWKNIYCALGSKCYLFAEDAATHISKLTTDENINIATCSGVVLKYINQTKVSDLIELTGILEGDYITILGSPDGESLDESLVDLAVGLGARFVKLGGLSRGERVAKYNRLLAIEEELAANGTLRTSFFLTLFSASTIAWVSLK